MVVAGVASAAHLEFPHELLGIHLAVVLMGHYEPELQQSAAWKEAFKWEKVLERTEMHKEAS